MSVRTLHTSLEDSLGSWADCSPSSAFLFLPFWTAAEFKQRLTNMYDDMLHVRSQISTWANQTYLYLFCVAADKYCINQYLCIFVSNVKKINHHTSGMFLFCVLYWGFLEPLPNLIRYVFQNNFYLQHHKKSQQTFWLTTFLLCCCRLFSLDVCEHFVRKGLRYPVQGEAESRALFSTQQSKQCSLVGIG